MTEGILLVVGTAPRGSAGGRLASYHKSMRLFRSFLTFIGLRRDPSYMVVGVATTSVKMGGFLVIPETRYSIEGDCFVAEEDIPDGSIIEVNFSAGKVRRAR